MKVLIIDNNIDPETWGATDLRLFAEATPGPWHFFTAEEAATVEAFVDRLIPPDPHTPGDQGATFAGLLHVPAGETFTRTPQTGVVTPSTPGNN